ncbi:ferredoxin reductase [Aquabacterium sp.]|uniref:ferredoxin reductase n=1 Tax=Aquabacterium sp. TaxID=1872578 RepID=UPI0024870320|nr:ferredoxin reductase [Aquabacterium sp.]MDI1259777.1 ferredoxin reductase [Aquabacterium sp.]
MVDHSSSSLTPSAMGRVSGWLTHWGISPLAFDDTLSLISPLLTVTRLHARVIAKQSETPGATTLVMQAGSAFRGLQPGQFILFSVVIDGVRHRRAYSPRSVDGRPGRFAITVQRQPGGLMSNHLNEHTKVGDIIEIDHAGGAFTLPAATPSEVLLMAGGSGITPCMAMLEHLLRSQAATRATLIYFARGREDRIFAQALDDMAKRWPQFTYVAIDSVANTVTGPGAQAQQQVLDVALLDQTAPQWRQTLAYCCGPAPLMDAARQLWLDAGIGVQLHLEAFAPAKPSGDTHAVHSVHMERARQTHSFSAPGDLTILVAGEMAGLTMKHGCRQGICHECTCRLRSGSVRDLTSGARIDGEGQPIRLCVSAAMSDLDLESLN